MLPRAAHAASGTARWLDRLVEPDWAGKLASFTLLFEALIITPCREMPFAAVSRLVNLSWHRVAAICARYVDLALAQADFSEVSRLAADETSRAKGHDYITLFADADERKVLFVAEGRGADTVEAFAEDLIAHQGEPAAIESASIDMSPAFIKGMAEHLPNARITFDKFHVIAHASSAVDKTRRIEPRCADVCAFAGNPVHHARRRAVFIPARSGASCAGEAFDRRPIAGIRDDPGTTRAARRTGAQAVVHRKEESRDGAGRRPGLGAVLRIERDPEEELSQRVFFASRPRPHDEPPGGLAPRGR